MRGSTPSVKVTRSCYSAWLRDIHGHRYTLTDNGQGPYIFTINPSNLVESVLQSIIEHLLTLEVGMGLEEREGECTTKADLLPPCCKLPHSHSYVMHQA